MKGPELPPLEPEPPPRRSPAPLRLARVVDTSPFTILLAGVEVPARKNADYSATVGDQVLVAVLDTDLVVVCQVA